MNQVQQTAAHSGPQAGPPAANTQTALAEPSAPDLARLPGEQIHRMREALEEMLRCQEALKRGGLNLVGEVLKGQGTFYRDAHYPDKDVYDGRSHSQYYYHAHRKGEHGHFHTFMRAAGMPSGCKRAPWPHAEKDWPAGQDAISHLIAVSMDRHGEPLGLFTTNRWVTGETWYPATDVISMLDHFRIDHAYPSWPLNRWLTALMILYRPHIEILLAHRDRAVRAWQSRYPLQDALEDHGLETIGTLPIDLDAIGAQLRRLTDGTARRFG